jgi:hypothetical protein
MTDATIAPANRSRATNGSSLFWIDDADGRSAPARRFKDILGAVVSDLGGLDLLSEGQKQLARRAAMLSLECERLEGASISGETIDIEVYASLTDRLGRCLQRLGLKRQARDVTLAPRPFRERIASEAA